MSSDPTFSLVAELRDCDLFAAFPEEALATLCENMELVRVRTGHVLFRAGDRADALYVVLHGRLRAVMEAGDRVLGDIGHGGYVGEMALLSGGVRSATVVAVRDSMLARLSIDAFEHLISSCPRAAIAMARTVATRSQRNIGAALQTEGFSTLCLLTDDEAAADQFAEGFIAGLLALDSTKAVPMEIVPQAALDAADRMSGTGFGWFEALERSARFIVYRCSPRHASWTENCLKRSDLVLAVASPTHMAALMTLVSGQRGTTVASLDAVLLHAGTIAAGAANKLRDAHSIRYVLHAREGSRSDSARAARLLAGRSIGLAFSGGGRRGAAHVGTMRALQEAGIAPDVVAGTSAGAIVGAMVAQEHDWRLALENVHRLGRMRAWMDIGPPMVSMLSGITMRRVLEGCFGDTQIEDTPIPFLPVCSAIDTGKVVIPDTGPLWLAVRASASLPGVFAPVPWKGNLLMDGALLNNLPADLVRARCPHGRVIASDVGMPSVHAGFPDDLHSMSGWRLLAGRWKAASSELRPPGFIDLLVNAACAASTAHLGAVREVVDCYIAPRMDDYPLLSRRAGQDIDVMIERAYDQARRALDGWSPEVCMLDF